MGYLGRFEEEMLQEGHLVEVVGYEPRLQVGHAAPGDHFEKFLYNLFTNNCKDSKNKAFQKGCGNAIPVRNEEI